MNVYDVWENFNSVAKLHKPVFTQCQITVCKYILAFQKRKWCVVRCVMSKNRFEKRDNSEKINMEISGGLIWLDETSTRPTQILGSPADQCNLWKKSLVTLQSQQELTWSNYMTSFISMEFYFPFVIRCHSFVI